MKKTALIVATTVVIGAVLGLHPTPSAAGSIHHLDYPAYVAMLLRMCKRLCEMALTALGFPPESVWTCAKFVFTLTRGTIAHATAIAAARF